MLVSSPCSSAILFCVFSCIMILSSFSRPLSDVRSCNSLLSRALVTSNPFRSFSRLAIFYAMSFSSHPCFCKCSFPNPVFFAATPGLVSLEHGHTFRLALRESCQITGGHGRARWSYKGALFGPPWPLDVAVVKLVVGPCNQTRIYPISICINHPCSTPGDAFS